LCLALVIPAAASASAVPGGVAKAKRCKKVRKHGKKKRKCKKRQQPAAPAPVTGPATTRPVGSPPLTSAQAAALVRRSSWEPRPQNTPENHTVPTVAQLAAWHPLHTMPYSDYVDGQFTGTTDEIIQWASYKWGIDENVMRAVATVEAWWDQDTLGDNGDSFGIYQVRRPYHCIADCALIRDSTAMTADYYGGIIRAYYDGKQTWLNNPDVAPQNGAHYAAGDLWGSIGAWFDGRWHTASDTNYVNKIQQRLAERTWTLPYFVGQ